MVSLAMWLGTVIEKPSVLLERLERRTVLATFGLISASKGLELVVEALPSIVAAHPDACYLIAGQTHPEVVKQDGEQYRLGLERLVRDLGLTDHVDLRGPVLDRRRTGCAAGRHRSLPDALPVP